MTSLSSLIERLERASGPDRELDRAIQVFDLGELPYGPIPRFTSSLDDAVSLIPIGWIWDVASSGCAWVMPPENLEGHIVVSGIESPAIALCIAALRARAANDGGGNG